MGRRANALIPLSWDHHAALMVSRTILGTLAGDARFGEPSHERMREMVNNVWSHKLGGHLDDEESVFCARALASGDPALIEAAEQVIAEHQTLALAAMQVERADAEALPPRLEAFASLLHDHIRFEERVFFPQLESKLPAEELDRLGLQLDARRTKHGRGSPREGLVVRGELFG